MILMFPFLLLGLLHCVRGWTWCSPTTHSEDGAQGTSHPSCPLSAAVVVPGAAVFWVRLEFIQRFIHLMQCQPQDEVLIPHLQAVNPEDFCHCCSLCLTEEGWGSFALERGSVLVN